MLISRCWIGNFADFGSHEVNAAKKLVEGLLAAWQFTVEVNLTSHSYKKDEVMHVFAIAAISGIGGAGR